MKRASASISILEVTRVPKASEAPAPAQSKIFAQPTELLPEPHRNLVPTDAVDIYVERFPRQVGGPFRKGAPSPNERRLLRARAYRRRDLKRKTGISNHIDQPPRHFLDIWRQIVDMAERSVRHVRHIRSSLCFRGE